MSSRQSRNDQHYFKVTTTVLAPLCRYAYYIYDAVVARWVPSPGDVERWPSFTSGHCTWRTSSGRSRLLQLSCGQPLRSFVPMTTARWRPKPTSTASASSCTRRCSGPVPTTPRETWRRRPKVPRDPYYPNHAPRDIGCVYSLTSWINPCCLQRNPSDNRSTSNVSKSSSRRYKI